LSEGEYPTKYAGIYQRPAESMKDFRGQGLERDWRIAAQENPMANKEFPIGIILWPKGFGQIPKGFG